MTSIFLRRHIFSRTSARRLFALVAVTGATITSLHAQGSVIPQTTPSNSTQPVTTGEISNLDPGKRVKRSIAGAEAHRYRVQLQTGQCARVEVEQHGVDVAAQLLGNDDSALVEAEESFTVRGAKELEFVADHDGLYTIRVTPRLKHPGAYEIRLSELRPATDLDRTLFEVRQLRAQYSRLKAMDKSGPAVPLAEKALALATQALGKEDVYVAVLTAELADIRYAAGNVSQAKAGFEQALKILTAKLDREQIQVIRVMTRLGSLEAAVGDPAKADELLGQALEDEEKTLGPDDPMVAITLKSLGVLHAGRSDYAKAEAEDRRALAILEKAGLTEQIFYGELLNNLGVIYNNRDELDKAQQYYERALAFYEKRFGPESESLSKTLNNLGVVARKRGDYESAEKYYGRALVLKKKYLGPDHPEYAAVLMNLGNVYSSEGNYQRALETHLQALQIFEKNPDDGPPIISLANIAKLYAALGDIENANKMQARLDSALEEDIVLNLTLGSEREKRAYLDWVSDRTDRTISLNLQLEPGNPQAAAMAATVLLQRKGRLLDATADTYGALRKHSNAEDQALLDQLKEATTRFARLALEGPGKQQTHEQYRKALDELQEQKEKLEDAMTHHSEEFRAGSQPVTLEAVRTAIPEDTVLVEFITYQPFNPKAKTDAQQYGDLRYAVYVLRRHAPPTGIDLGDAKSIDALVEKFRAALRDPDSNDALQLSRALAAKVFQPVQSLVADGKRLLISPDGKLDLIPFEALQDAQGQYLVERFSITYLTTGRDLLRMQVPRSSGSAPVIVADPFFGESQGPLVAKATASPAKLSARSARRSVTTGSDYSNLYFAPLAGTKIEAESISALLPDARVLTGKQASEAALEMLKAPRILHIATHGFFLQGTGRQADSLSGENASQGRVAADLENPLLRSGLALSGANLVKDGKGEGILTALEATNLDLWGTKLVTLSACDTGVGEVKNGEGVYGLRRSFFLAGAETLVMSLWPVSDRVTREMMTAYYNGLKQGLGRGEALRQAELAMMKRKDRQHPFYWASFIQSGEWANLDGKR